MPPVDTPLDTTRLPAPLPIRHARVDRKTWSALARAMADRGGRLVSMWATDRPAEAGGLAACAALADAEGLLWLELPLDDADHGFPDLSPVFACAGRLQRAMADLSGLHALGSVDTRPWLDHGLWTPGPAPLQPGAQPGPATTSTLPADYPFVRVEGDGVHEIAVGPVHAGIIEPGHFRFSVVGE